MKIDIERIILIDTFIRKKSTGKPDELAQRLGISRRSLFGTLNFMKASLKAPIVYNRDENSYVYEEHGLFCFIYDTKQKGEIPDNETREL
jgi:hypothetical protein